MSGIQAIVTHYDGHVFRSRLEARWAVFFNALEIPYDYEREGYELSDGTRYLPDFWLPEQQCYVEIKGQEATISERRKALLLAQQSDHPVYIFEGGVVAPRFETYLEGHALIYHPLDRAVSPKVADCTWFECTGCHGHYLDYDHALLYGTEGPQSSRCIQCPAYLGPLGIRGFALSAAYDAARSARFEFGQTPAVPR
jgi:hypothetical protein